MSTNGSTTITTSKKLGTLYDIGGWVNPIRVRIVLQEKGLADQVEYITVDPAKGEHRTPEHYKRSPAGTVPVLELPDGTYIDECTAITEYLDNIDGKPLFTGTTVKERAVIAMRQRHAEMQVLDPIGIWFHYATNGLGKEVESKREWYSWSHREEWGQLSKQTAIKGYKFFDQLLQKQFYLAGDKISMADLTLLAGLHFGRVSGVPVPEELTTLIAWNKRLVERYYTGQNPISGV